MTELSPAAVAPPKVDALLHTSSPAGGTSPGNNHVNLGAIAEFGQESNQNVTSPAKVREPLASAESIVDQIARLVEMRDGGLLTDQEFAQAKARLLN